tara:strand:+ start:173 stop:352 length:180 start_codon:yes stop_codon:yes gene_type:complete
MSEFQVAADTFPIWKAVLWIFYPMAMLVMAELLLRGFGDDDDDDPEGGVMSPVYAPSGA